MLLLLLWVAAGSSSAAERAVTPAGKVEPQELVELSGLAVSRRVGGRWWGHNDSGNPAQLFALDVNGRARGALMVDAPNVDWEDIASYWQQGVAYLAIADTGDNFSLRRDVSILILREPDQALPEHLALDREIRFTFEDGPRDCESLAADPLRDRFLLIDKSRHPAGLYQLPMHPAPGVAVARRIADLPPLWRGDLPATSMIGAERIRGSATAMDLSPDGRQILVLTYRHLALLERAEGEDWAQALSRPPKLLPLPPLRIAEAVGWDAAASGALIGGEGEHSLLLRWNGTMPP